MNPTVFAITYAASMLETNNTWQENAKWFGTAFIIVSAILVSLSVTLAVNPLAFVGFLLGHIVWFASAFIMRDKPLMGLNGFLLIVDLYAIFIRL